MQGAQARRYVVYEIEGNVLRVRRRGFECREKKKQFWKRVLFTNRMGMRAEEMIELDGERRKVEDVFNELKDRSEVSMWPIRNWTDTKIRMHAFCCVPGLLLLKLLLLEAEQAGLSMSARVWLLAMGAYGRRIWCALTRAGAGCWRRTARWRNSSAICTGWIATS